MNQTFASAQLCAKCPVHSLACKIVTWQYESHSFPTQFSNRYAHCLSIIYDMRRVLFQAVLRRALSQTFGFCSPNLFAVQLFDDGLKMRDLQTQLISQAIRG